MRGDRPVCISGISGPARVRPNVSCFAPFGQMSIGSKIKLGLQPPWSIAITLILNSAVFLGVPHMLIAPVWLSWPRAFFSLGLGLLPVVWSCCLLFHSKTRADWIVSAISGILGLFWLVMSANLVWVMFRALTERS